TTLSNRSPDLSHLPFKPLEPQTLDDLVLADKFNYRVLISQGELLNAKSESFGTNNDYINWVDLPGREGSEIVMWVNHEYPEALLLHGQVDASKKTKAQIEIERKAVGGSLIHFRKSSEGWGFVPKSEYNRRIDGTTPIPLISSSAIAGAKVAIGTFANCAGGKTPRGEILTCEENFDQFVGDVTISKDGQRTVSMNKGDDRGWRQYLNLPPEHYGWVVEVKPLTGEARKLTALGRFAHESATVTVGSDKRWVVYSGDDAKNQCLYKFISSQPESLDDGTLYVASLEQGRWIPLNLQSNPKLRSHFRDQMDVLIQTRSAAKIAGGTPLDRPEDIEIDPVTRSVIVSLTNNKPKGNYHGSLLRLHERNSDPLSLEFESETFMPGGEVHGFSCPDNLAFDSQGNLWRTTDISGKSMNQGEYAAFGNNGLFYIPLQGPNAGFVFQIASAPKDAEFTGPCFSPGGKSLFLSVQHPGETSPNLNSLTSHWPLGRGQKPRSSVVEIRGPLFD
ncbi:MAG: DUF839 domain-containing protein, partial [Bdellovibrionales bacterium]|nr:DUF839 domain-containing protein [Bdellovibrionales bacterium]